MRGARVVGEALLDQARERRPHHGAVDAELVHQREAGSGAKKARERADRLPEDLASRLALGFPVLKNSAEAPGAATTSKVGFGCSR